jgi:hypothetical protein
MNNVDAYALFSFTLEFEWYFLIAINFVGLRFFYTSHGVKFCSSGASLDINCIFHLCLSFTVYLLSHPLSAFFVVMHILIHFLSDASTVVSRKIGMLLV